MTQSATGGKKALIDSIDRLALWSSTVYEVVLIDGVVKCHTLCPNRSTNEEVKLVHLQLNIHKMKNLPELSSLIR